MIETTKNAFKIILPNINAKYEMGSNPALSSEPLASAFDGVPTSAREEKVLEYARIHGAITRNDVIGLFGVSPSTGLKTLYLITDHTGFYERYGWEFLCMVQGDGESDLTKMYSYDL